MKRNGIFLALVLWWSTAAQADDNTFNITGSDGISITATVLNLFDEPWAMTLLPDGRLLVTEKTGALVLVGPNGERQADISGMPSVSARGQGGLGDIILHPDFENNQRIYLSYVEREGGRSGAAVDTAVLSLSEGDGALTDRQRIWTQTPKESGGRHYAYRLIFDTNGYLFITSGDRGQQSPAQDMGSTLGKIIRLHDDGRVPDDNPFAGGSEVQAQIWSLGHRNPLGIALDANGQIWAHEMGPRGGDELNRIVRGANYGWPVVSDGRQYSGRRIPDHNTTDAFTKPAISWVPAISPAGLVIYQGAEFSDWQGHALIGALGGRALVRVSLSEDIATEVARYKWNERVREIEELPSGALLILEDGNGGRLLKLEADEANGPT